MLTQLVTLLPCQSLEDFDIRRKQDDAEQLLASWSALWHPELLAAAQRLPGWSPAANPPPDLEGCLIVVPDCCLPSLPEGWLVGAEAAGAVVLRSLPHRDEIVAAALAHLERGRPPVEPDLTADFLALGYCHFQVELLTHQWQYSSNLDGPSLGDSALAAAGAAVADNAAAAREHLQAAFDRLHEAREYCCSAEVRLLDLTLVAPSTLGRELRDELTTAAARNLLATAETIEEMARREPETLDRLAEALAAGTATLVGGERVETPLPMLGPEAVRLRLVRGLAAYQKYLGRWPVVFGRRRFGLSPALPQILRRLGFTGAVHCTFDDGRFPTSDQGRIQWAGIDGTAIDSFGGVPLDAGRADSFLGLAKRLGDAANTDSAAAIMFAHWPGRSCCWYDDLRRIAAYSSVLGTFSTLADYFDEAGLSGSFRQYSPDEYHSPYLQQDVAAGRRDPISRWVRYFARRAKFEAGRTLAMLATCGRGEGRGARGERPKLECAVEDSLDADEIANAAMDKELTARLEEPLVGFARAITGDAASTKRGVLVVNPWSFPQQTHFSPVDLPTRETSPAASLPLLADVPPMGFCWIDGDAPAPTAPGARRGWFSSRRSKEPPLAEENVLRNEFCEVHFDPRTGAIRSITDYTSRDPRLSQQIALRLPCGDDPAAEANYSIMAADELVVTSAGPALGEMVVRGRLVDREGRRAAGFQQTTRLRRGSRVVELRIDLDVDRPPGADPWDSYYAVRFAWKDESSTLCRSVGLACVPTDLRRIESPQLIDIRRAAQRTTLLCGGLPYHRRIGPRKLDTLLAPRGETARSFRLGIGIDVPHPLSAALGFLAPPLSLPDWPAPPRPAGWFFHLDSRNVLATHWEVLDENESEHENSRGLTAPGGSAEKPTQVRGFRVRLLETDGRAISAGLRCFRAPSRAGKVNLGDAAPEPLTIDGDRIAVPIGSYEWAEVEVELR